MERIESRCVDCGLPCIRQGCPYYRVRVLYCDRCGEEVDHLNRTIYDEELCDDCMEEEMEDWED